MTSCSPSVRTTASLRSSPLLQLAHCYARRRDQCRPSCQVLLPFRTLVCIGWPFNSKAWSATVCARPLSALTQVSNINNVITGALVPALKLKGLQNIWNDSLLATLPLRQGALPNGSCWCATRTEQYRENATLCEREAKSARNESVRAAYLKLAESWRELARQVEESWLRTTLERSSSDHAMSEGNLNRKKRVSGLAIRD